MAICLEFRPKLFLFQIFGRFEDWQFPFVWFPLILKLRLQYIVEYLIRFPTSKQLFSPKIQFSHFVDKSRCFHLDLGCFILHSTFSFLMVQESQVMVLISCSLLLAYVYLVWLAYFLSFMPKPCLLHCIILNHFLAFIFVFGFTAFQVRLVVFLLNSKGIYTIGLARIHIPEVHYLPTLFWVIQT